MEVNMLRKVMFLVTVFIISVFFAACGNAQAKIKEVSVEQANTAVQEKNVQFIDVRTPAEFSEGFAQKAVNFPLDTLEKDLAKLNKTKPVYLICRTGRRSLTGAEILDKAGFSEVYNVAGGTVAWKAANLPMGSPTTEKPQTVQTSKVDDKTKQALIDSLTDERKAEATYQAIINKFGQVRPFINIIEAEKRHQSMLLPLFEKYGVEIPKNEFDAAKITIPESLVDSCKAGIQAEKDNAAMYDKFFQFVAEEDIKTVFTHLRDASIQNHLPAFERCSQGRGMGNGQGRGQGRPF
jgi:rhodanese-related sulfurtransferase